MKQIILWVLSKIYYTICNRKAQVFLRIFCGLCILFHIIFACKKIDIKQILLSAKSDGAVKVELERCADSLAKAVTNAATVIAPDSVVAFGYMFENDIFDLFAKRCAQYYSGFGCRSLAPGRVRVDTDARRSKEISRRARREPAVKL